jgi:hypothetical protein
MGSSVAPIVVANGDSTASVWAFRNTQVTSSGGGSGGVTRLVAGPNITLNPPTGLGEVTVTGTGGGGGGVTSVTASSAGVGLTVTPTTGAVVVRNTEPASTWSGYLATQNVKLNDFLLNLRNTDLYHYLKYQSSGVDGPELGGYGGGRLVSTAGAVPTVTPALTWSGANVSVAGTLTAGSGIVSSIAVAGGGITTSAASGAITLTVKKSPNTYTLPNTLDYYLPVAYIKLGSWSTFQTGKKLSITVTAGQGYNEGEIDIQSTNLVLNTRNGSYAPYYVTGAATYDSALGLKTNSPSLFYINAVTTTLFDVYGVFSSFTGDGSFYTVAFADGDTWVNAATASTTEPTGLVITPKAQASVWSRYPATETVVLNSNAINLAFNDGFQYIKYVGSINGPEIAGGLGGRLISTGPGPNPTVIPALTWANADVTLSGTLNAGVISTAKPGLNYQPLTWNNTFGSGFLASAAGTLAYSDSAVPGDTVLSASGKLILQNGSGVPAGALIIETNNNVTISNNLTLSPTYGSPNLTTFNAGSTNYCDINAGSGATPSVLRIVGQAGSQIFLQPLNIGITVPASGVIYTSTSPTYQFNGADLKQPVIQYGTATGSGATGSITVTIPTTYTSTASYVVQVTMQDAPPAQLNATPFAANQFQIGWTSAGTGTQKIMWTTFGT